jgi:hypothetical protein
MKNITLIGLFSVIVSFTLVEMRKINRSHRDKKDILKSSLGINIAFNSDSKSDVSCLAPNGLENFIGQEARFCPKLCPYSRCTQSGVLCCYYHDPTIKMKKYGDSGREVVTLEGNYNEYTGNGNFGSGYPISDGSESYSSKYGSPYKYDQGFSSDDGLRKRKRTYRQNHKNKRRNKN